jgi:hypothetical protein
MICAGQRANQTPPSLDELFGSGDFARLVAKALDGLDVVRRVRKIGVDGERRLVPPLRVNKEQRRVTRSAEDPEREAATLATGGRRYLAQSRLGGCLFSRADMEAGDEVEFHPGINPMSLFEV